MIAILQHTSRSLDYQLTATQLMSMPSLVKSNGIRSAFDCSAFDRSAAAMHWWPEPLMSLIVALRIMLMAKAALPVRVRLWSSRKVTSFTQNKRFSIAQRSRHKASNSSAVEDSTERLVTA